MATDLIIDFPLQRNHQAVRFDERVQLYIVDRRHEDNEDKKKLWYTKSDYNSMKRKLKQDVLRARANDAAAFEEDSGFWIGIAHLLTPACMVEVKTCRFRCVRAVLAEQVRQSPSTSFGWEDIALASLAETGKAVLRARKLDRKGETYEELSTFTTILFIPNSYSDRLALVSLCSKIPLSSASDSESLLIDVVEKQERDDIEPSRVSLSSALEEQSEGERSLCLVSSLTGWEWMDSD
eukprot:scaffold14250_cov89-Skeletonema_dohrnii-CCMP3373.AAC.4